MTISKIKISGHVPNRDFCRDVNLRHFSGLTAKSIMPWQPSVKGTSVNADPITWGYSGDCQCDQILKELTCVPKAEHMELLPSTACRASQ